ncbi:MAG: hypothetical protein ABIX11_14295, partial [Casimicrobiaceae bacterium]
IYDTYFGGAAAVALLARDGKLLVMPLVADSAGGTLLKIRNRHGDRVIHAQEFFRDKGFAEDADAQTVDARWSADAAALVVEGLRAAPSALRAIGNTDAN